MVVRLRLTGSGPLHAELVREGAAGELCSDLNRRMERQVPFFWCERIAVRTAPPFDREERMAQEDFLADVLTMIRDLREDPDALSDLVYATIDPLYEGTRAGHLLRDRKPNAEDLVSLLEAADAAILTELVERR